MEKARTKPPSFNYKQNNIQTVWLAKALSSFMIIIIINLGGYSIGDISSIYGWAGGQGEASNYH